MSPRDAFTLAHVAANATYEGVRVDTNDLQRNAGLQFTLSDDGLAFWMHCNGEPFPPKQPWGAKIRLSPTQVFGRVEDCRRVWQQNVVDLTEVVQAPEGGQTNARPFEDRWDLSSRRELLEKALPALAVAGDQLFYRLFGSTDDQNLTRVARQLRDAAAAGPLVMTVTSDSFFLPWSMLYTHPGDPGGLKKDGSNARPEGFWGYRHIVEHNPLWVDLEQTIRAVDGRIHTSLNIDDRLDVDLGVPCIAPQLAFFEALQFVRRTERRSRPELQSALSDPEFSDQILYFCCHGVGGDAAAGPNLGKAQIELADRLPIDEGQIDYWLQERDLRTHPIVFVNACQGGQMTTVFYQTLARIFLQKKAVAVIGSQVDIPAVFAAEYAIRLFKRLFNEGKGQVRLGPLMRDLAREFIDTHRNPLGLVYALYRGADCYINWQQPVGQDAESTAAGR